MFSLVYSLFKQLTKYKEYRILIVGIASSGKTTFLEGVKEIFTGKPALQKIFPTTGLNLHRIPVGDSRFTFWDLGGRKEHRQIVWPNYIPDAQAIIYVVDSSESLANLQEAKDTLHELLNSGQLSGPIPLLLVCNKKDISGARSPREVEDFFELYRYENAIAAYRIQATQANTKDGIKEGVEWLLSYMKSFVQPLQV